MNKKNRSYLASLFVVIISLFPSQSKRLWKKWYDFLASHDDVNDFNFMNYGFFDEEYELTLLASDEKNRFQIQLYDHVLSGLDLSDKSLLEAGSGRGGGLDYLSRYKNLQQLSGVDLSTIAIKKCRTLFPSDKISFINASADKIPQESQTVDIVLNVESSHCYPDMQAFVNETWRLLKPGGYFAICDIRNGSGIDEMESSFKRCGYTVVKKDIISDNVLQALEKMSDARMKISDKVPAVLRKAFIDFAGVESSSVYDMLKDNKLQYVSYLLKKEKTWE